MRASVGLPMWKKIYVSIKHCLKYYIVIFMQQYSLHINVWAENPQYSSVTLPNTIRPEKHLLTASGFNKGISLENGGHGIPVINNEYFSNFVHLMKNILYYLCPRILFFCLLRNERMWHFKGMLNETWAVP